MNGPSVRPMMWITRHRVLLMFLLPTALCPTPSIGKERVEPIAPVTEWAVRARECVHDLRRAIVRQRPDPSKNDRESQEISRKIYKLWMLTGTASPLSRAADEVLFRPEVAARIASDYEEWIEENRARSQEAVVRD